MITVSQKFLQEFIKLIDSRRFYKNFTKLNYEYNIAPQDFELYTLKKVLAIADNYHICRNEYSQICIVGRSEEFHMELDFADKILEVYDEIIKPQLTSDSELTGSSLFTK